MYFINCICLYLVLNLNLSLIYVIIVVKVFLGSKFCFLVFFLGFLGFGLCLDFSLIEFYLCNFFNFSYFLVKLGFLDWYFWFFVSIKDFSLLGLLFSNQIGGKIGPYLEFGLDFQNQNL